jgi:hypothetical protein
MFDMSKLGDMSKLASQAKKVQEEQERSQKEQTDLLRKISLQLEDIVKLLKESDR